MSEKQAQKMSLQVHIDQFVEVLYEDDFTARDLDGTMPERKYAIELLSSNGAIRKKESLTEDKGSHRYWKWEWVNHQTHLQNYLENRDELPKCEHRPHIPPERDGDTFYCKFCGEPYSREVIESAL